MRGVILSAKHFKAWVKSREHPAARFIYKCGKGLRHFSLPVVPPLHGLLYGLHRGVSLLASELTRICWTTPLFQSRLVAPAPRLCLYGGLPHIMGPLEIEIGPDCQISGQISLVGRGSGPLPRLQIGSGCSIGWQSTIAVGSRIVLGDKVMLASKILLAGFPGHPLNPVARAAGLPETDDQVGDIILEDAVWLATGVVVVAGVRIGQGTVVAAGSVVTHDLPPGVLAAGVPAKVIRALVPGDPAVSETRLGSPVTAGLFRPAS